MEAVFPSRSCDNFCGHGIPRERDLAATTAFGKVSVPVPPIAPVL